MKSTPHNSAFTLVEMLVVISIIGILAAIAMPVVANFRKADSMLAATRQMQDDVERARMLAISQRTTVYMIFCPSNFWKDPAYNTLPQTEKDKAAKLYDKQLAGYNFVTLRSVGNQPGQVSPRYLSEWRTLPEGAIIPTFKFVPRSSSVFTTIYDPPLPATTLRSFRVHGFSTTNGLPFPSAEAYNPTLPNQRFVTVTFIAFDHLGQLASREDEYIPLAKGNVNQARDVNKIPMNPPQSPTVTEQPPGSSTNAFTLVHIEWLTGRARMEKQEFK